MIKRGLKRPGLRAGQDVLSQGRPRQAKGKPFPEEAASARWHRAIALLTQLRRGAEHGFCGIQWDSVEHCSIPSQRQAKCKPIIRSLGIEKLNVQKQLIGKQFTLADGNRPNAIRYTDCTDRIPQMVWSTTIVTGSLLRGVAGTKG